MTKLLEQDRRSVTALFIISRRVYAYGDDTSSPLKFDKQFQLCRMAAVLSRARCFHSSVGSCRMNPT